MAIAELDLGVYSWNEWFQYDSSAFANVAVWMQTVAYSYTDVNFDSDVWVCLDIDITTLAK